MSEAWWSCRGSISRSGSHRSVRSDPEFYSDDSEEIINNVNNDPKVTRGNTVVIMVQFR